MTKKRALKGRLRTARARIHVLETQNRALTRTVWTLIEDLEEMAENDD